MQVFTTLISSFLNSNPQDSNSQVLFYFQTLCLMVCLSCIFTCKFSFSAAIPHIYIFRTLLVSHKLNNHPHYTHISIHSTCNRATILSSKCWMKASKMNENWKSSKMRDLWPWTDSLRCQYFTCIFYWMGKQGPFAVSIYWKNCCHLCTIFRADSWVCLQCGDGPVLLPPLLTGRFEKNA